MATCLSITPPAFADPLREGFVHPPQDAKPRVWWHWLNGNISQEGAALDLAWMKRVGIGGAQTFDANLGTPQVVAKRLVFMTPEWKAAFRASAQAAQDLDLELAIASSPGWSETGGPWVTPAQAMKKLVWSQTQIAGGRRFQGVLAPPPAVAGPFQAIQASQMHAGGKPDTGPGFYADAAVIAYRTPPAQDAAVAKVSASDPAFPVARLSDGDLASTATLAFQGPDQQAWIAFTYPEPLEVRSITLTAPGPRGFGAPALPRARLEASQDGVSFSPVTEIALGGGVQQTVSFPAVRGRVFRVLFSKAEGGGPPPAPPGVILPHFSGKADGYLVSELTLSTQTRVNHFEDKAGFSTAQRYDVLATAAAPHGDVVARSDVIDVTADMKPDGRLDWTPPPGDWTVLRLGYALTGRENGPASAEGTGLEVDKLSATHVRAYLDHYLGLYADAAGPDLIGAKGVRALLNDSIESGPQNWTDDMVAQFIALRGYDPRPWLPALTGQIIDSPEATDKFLWDFRRTIAQLLATNHYGEIAKAAKARGLKVYGEALEDHRPQLGDDMEMRRFTDVPMGAMWVVPDGGRPNPTYLADTKGAASVAHIYDQNIAAAESFTAYAQPWAFSPRDLKRTADLMFAQGINRVIVHTSVHQPLIDRAPGLALAPFLGQYFNRNETWAEDAGPWIDYLSRSSFLLQQGRYVADVAYFYGEEAPLTALFGDAPPADAPVGHGYDFVNADVILNHLSVEDDALATTGGGRYRVLYLSPAADKMTLPVLRKLKDLVQGGATVVGQRPVGSPSLSDDDATFQSVADQLWPRGGGDTTIGRGRVIADASLDAALERLGVAPDVRFGSTGDQDQPLTLHRRSEAADLYFISNQQAHSREVVASFRVTGRRPHLWNAVTGAIEAVAFTQQEGRTEIALKLDPDGSVFVVFDDGPAAPPSGDRAARPIARFDGPWDVHFQAGRGAPAAVRFQALSSWSENQDPGVRYFSGSATYVRTLRLDRKVRKGRVVLDLGEVRDLARVKVNGRDLGVVWTPPYRLDVSTALKTGMNRFEITVTNPWANRLIGDAQPGAKPVTFTTGPTYLPTAPLRPAGLIGPVRLERVE
jgi:hypothetical protein